MSTQATRTRSLMRRRRSALRPPTACTNRTSPLMLEKAPPGVESRPRSLRSLARSRRSRKSTRITSRPSARAVPSRRSRQLRPSRLRIRLSQLEWVSLPLRPWPSKPRFTNSSVASCSNTRDSSIRDSRPSYCRLIKAGSPPRLSRRVRCSSRRVSRSLRLLRLRLRPLRHRQLRPPRVPSRRRRRRQRARRVRT